MVGNLLISITQAEFDAKVKEIADHEAKALAGREWLRAAEILLKMKNGTAGIAIKSVSPSTNGHVESGKDLTAAIEKLATLSATPITKSNLKGHLRAQGFAEDRLGNYFYTAIMRLKKSNRIQVLEDGTIWGPHARTP